MTLNSAIPFFLDLPSKRLFALLFNPAPTAVKQGVILHCPAFAEEMNKSRAMVVAQARAMAAQGFTVLVPDYFGTGDSEGDFSATSWQIWLEDMRFCQQWLQRQYSDEIILWGLRLGALMALELASLSDTTTLILWNPVLQGEQFILQFLRLRLANSMIYGNNKEKLADLKLQLEQQGYIEVAGYQLSQALFEQLGDIKAKALKLPSVKKVLWTDVTTNGRLLAPVAQALVDQWKTAAIVVDVKSVEGYQFWSTLEISRADALIDVTIDWLNGTCIESLEGPTVE